jgi:hypothetical protein
LAKAYESIIKGTQIQGPKVPESFNVLVKELQGLGLKVDLLTNNNELIDAEEVLAQNIKEEAKEAVSEISEVSTIPTAEVTDEAVEQEIMGMGDDQSLSISENIDSDLDFESTQVEEEAK